STLILCYGSACHVTLIPTNMRLSAGRCQSNGVDQYWPAPAVRKRVRDKSRQSISKEARMAGKNTAAFGIYTTYAGVENAVDALKTAGFRNTDISVLFPENVGTKDFAHQKGTKAPEGATTGGVTGGIIGGTLGWLVGIGTLAIPGLGPFI